MSIGIISFIAVYCFFLLIYFLTETSGNMKLRAPNKIILALMFFVFGACNAFHYTQSPIQYLFIVALFLTMLGDIFLLYKFSMGGYFFLCGNIVFITYQIALFNMFGVGFNQYWWILILIPALWLIYPILGKIYPNSFKYGDKKLQMYFYLMSIVTNGVLGIVSATFLTSGFLMLGLGLILFMLSDFVIVLHKFVFTDNRWIHRLNSLLYFAGMLLVVLNFAI